jgi:gluconokinase
LKDEGLILALDIGTSSVRAALYDSQANRLDHSFVKNERTLDFTADGGAELDAEEALAQTIQAIDDVIKLVPELIEKVEFVVMSCFWHSLVGVDETGQPLTPVYSWADTRSKDFVQTLRDSFDESVIHNRTGARFHPSFWTAKLLWLTETQSTLFQQVKYWLQFSDFLAWRLFGQTVTNVSMASGSGVFDLRQCAWDEELIEFLGITQQKLPRIVGDKETFQLNRTFAARWDKLKDAKWFPAIGDGAANNVGAGCVTGEKAALMIGTSGAMRVIYQGQPPDKLPSGLWCYRLDTQRVIIGGALSDGGGLYRWLKDNFKLEDNDDDVEDEIAKRPPDSHGLTFLPFLAGERSTGYHENANGAILGLTQHTNAVEITQAALEAVAYRFAEIYEQLNEVVEIKQIIASGGALRESPVWTQIIADTLAQTLYLPEAREASSRGAVLQAQESIGKISGIADWPLPQGNTFSPNPENHQIYQSARQRQQKFYDLIYCK